VKVPHQCTLHISPCTCFSHSEQHRVVSACSRFLAQPCAHSMCTPTSVSMLFNPQCCASGPCSPQGSPRLIRHHQGQYLVCSALHLCPLLPFPVCHLSQACSCSLCLRACTLFLIWKDAITISLLFAPYSFLHFSLLLYVLEVPGSTLPLPI